MPTDITHPDQCDNLVTKAIKRFGRIDALINSAIITFPGMFEDADFEDWKKVMEVNCFGHLNLSQKVVPHMKKQGGGAIVNVNTKSFKDPEIGTGAYPVSKGALSAATRVMAKELGHIISA
ncbi:MAG: SDR family NAD(P)-dependent oxidoreductase [Hahellaceae bacterium]|nr:SDR family NAD(P)-dependent oxidoreductase [Hahellaceae bacterium]